MSIVVYKQQLYSQLKQMNQILEQEKSDARQIKSAIRSFASDTELKGKGYQSARDYFNTVHINIISQIISLCDIMINTNNQFGTIVNSKLTGGEDPVDQAKLEDTIKKLEQKIRDYQRQREAALKSLDQITPPTSVQESDQALLARSNAASMLSSIENLQKLLREADKLLRDLL